MQLPVRPVSNFQQQILQGLFLNIKVFVVKNCKSLPIYPLLRCYSSCNGLYMIFYNSSSRSGRLLSDLCRCLHLLVVLILQLPVRPQVQAVPEEKDTNH